MKTSQRYDLINFYLDSMDFNKIDQTLSYAFKIYFLDISFKINNENLSTFTNAMKEIILQCVEEAEKLKVLIKVDHIKYIDDYIPKLYDSVMKENYTQKILTFQILKKYRILFDLMIISNFYNKTKKWDQKKPNVESQIKEIENYLKEKKEKEKKEKLKNNNGLNPAQKLKNAIKKLQTPQTKIANYFIHQYDELVANKIQKIKNNEHTLNQVTNNPKIHNLTNNNIKENNFHFANLPNNEKQNDLIMEENHQERLHNNLKEGMYPMLDNDEETSKRINKLGEAKKYAEYAINELEFKKINTAIDYIEESIKILNL